jgi:hypothetical protein
VRRRGEEGQSLFLVPVGIVLVLMMGLLVADTAVVFLAKREVLDAATAAANDAAAAAIDAEVFRATGRLELRTDAVSELARQAVARRGSGLFGSMPSVDAWSAGNATVVVEVRGSVRGLLWSPFGGFSRQVSARVTAHASDGM